MIQGRKRHGARILPNGDVLVAGGEDGTGTLLASAEIYDYDQGVFLGAPFPMTEARTEFGMVFIAAFACRVSMQIAGQPDSVRLSCSQAASEQASIPTRATGRSSRTRASCKALGSLAARISFTIVPVASTTQIAVSSSDTSNPA